MVSSIRNVIFDTQGIATIVANEIDVNLPSQLAVIESSLIQTAPENSKKLVSNIKAIAPEINVKAKESINHVIAMMPTLREDLSGAIEAYFVENKEDMKSFVEGHSEQEFASYFMDDLLATLSLRFEEELKSEGGFDAIKSMSLKRLTSLNNHLNSLANKNRFDLTQDEQLQRRAIVSWVKLLENL